MKRRTAVGLAGLGVVALWWGIAVGFDTTSRLGLERPTAGEKNWATPLNFTIDRIDQLACFPGIACSVNLSTETTGGLPVDRIADDPTGGLCLLSGGSVGDPGWGVCPGGGSGGAPTDATYITQSANPTLSNEQPLGALSTGLLLNTVTAGTGVLSTFGGGTCAAGQVATGITASGALSPCVDPILETEMDSFSEWLSQVAVGGTCDATSFVRGDGVCAVPSGGGGSTNTWNTLTGDAGTATAVSSTDTLRIAGGVGVSTAAVEGTPDTLTVSFAPTEVTNATFGSGSQFLWTFNTGADPDPSIDFQDGAIVLNGAAFPLDFRVAGALASNLFVVDGHNACVGINGLCVGTGAVLNVAGAVQATGFVGNASTASALAANGANCPAGQAPLGVDAAGNAEGCFVASGGGGNAWTTLNGDTGNAVASPNDTLTIAGGTGISTSSVNGTPDTLTVAFAPTEVNTATFGSGSQFNWTFDTGADPDPIISFQDAAVVVNAAATPIDFRVAGSLASNLLVVDGHNACVGINGVCVGSGAMLNVSGSVQATGGFIGNATTASALAGNGLNCLAGQAAQGVDAAGNAEGCFTPPGGGGGGTGDVVGPASATDNAIVRFDTTTGKLVQNSGCLLSDTNNITGCSLTGNVTGNVSGNAATSTALSANGSNCVAGQAAAGVDASGNAEGCFTPGASPGTLIVQEADTTVVPTADTLDFGSGFNIAESPSGEANITFAPAEVTNPTWGPGTDQVWTFDVSGGTDPMLTLTAAGIDIGPGLFANARPVVTSFSAGATVLNELPVFNGTSGTGLQRYDLNANCVGLDNPADCCTGPSAGSCRLDIDATTGELRSPFGVQSQARSTGNCNRLLEPPAAGSNHLDECVPDSGLSADYTRTVRADGRYNPDVIRSATVGRCAQFNGTTGDLEPASGACGSSGASADVGWFPAFGPTATAETDPSQYTSDHARCWLFPIPYTMALGIGTVGYRVTTTDPNDVANLYIYSSSGASQYFAGTLDVTTGGTKSVTNTVGIPPAIAAGQYLACLAADDAVAPSFRLARAGESLMYGPHVQITATSGVLSSNISGSITSPLTQDTSFQPPALFLSIAGVTTTTTSSSSTSTSSSSTSTTSVAGTTSTSSTSSSTTSTSTSSTTTSTVSGQTVQVFFGGGSAAQGTSTTNYIAAGSGSTWNTAANVQQTMVTADGTIGALRIVLPTAPSPGQYVFTIQKNGSAAALTCTVSGSNTTCQDTNSLHNVSVVAGDRINLQSVGSGSAVTSSARWSVLFRPTTPDETIIASTGSYSNAALFGMPYGSTQSSEGNASLVAAVPGTIKNLRAWCETAVAASATRVWTLDLGIASPTSLTCTMNAGDTTCSDTNAGHNVTVSAGNLLSFSHAVTGTPGSTIGCTVGAVFVPTTTDRFLAGVDILGGTPVTGTVFAAINGANANFVGTSETSITQHIAQAVTVRTLAINTNLTPGSSPTCVLVGTLRQAGGDTGLTCTVASGGTTCSQSTNTSLNADDLIDTSLVNTGSGSCTQRTGRMGYAMTYTGAFP